MLLCLKYLQVQRTTSPWKDYTKTVYNTGSMDIVKEEEEQEVGGGGEERENKLRLKCLRSYIKGISLFK